MNFWVCLPDKRPPPMAMTKVETKVATWYPACCPEVLPSITKLPRLHVCEDCACAYVCFSAIMCWACMYMCYLLGQSVCTKVITFACYTYLANGLPFYPSAICSTTLYPQ